VKAVLGRLHSTISSKNRGSQVSKKAELLLSKFTQQLEKIFKNLPKYLEWRSFYLNDLPVLMDFCEEVREVWIQPQLSLTQLGLDQGVIFKIILIPSLNNKMTHSTHKVTLV